MDPPDRRLPRLRRLAWLCALLVLCITSLSAFIRLSRAGLDCTPWPQCHAQRALLDAQAVAALDTPAVGTARMVHRVTASAALLLVIAMLMLTLSQQPALWPQGRLVLVLLGLGLFLAILGRMAGDSRAALVTLGNLLGGFAMFAFSVRLAQASGPPRATLPVSRAWAFATFVLLLLQAGLGALVSAGHLITRCGEAALCEWHRMAGVALAAVLLALAWRARRAGRPIAATVIAGLAIVQAVLGPLLVASASPLAIALAHNLVAALLLAAVLGLVAHRSSPAAAQART